MALPRYPLPIPSAFAKALRRTGRHGARETCLSVSDILGLRPRRGRNERGEGGERSIPFFGFMVSMPSTFSCHPSFAPPIAAALAVTRVCTRLKSRARARSPIPKQGSTHQLASTGLGKVVRQGGKARW